MKKQTLSDKIGMKGQQLAIEAEDIKEFIKKMDYWIDKFCGIKHILHDKLREEAGDKLT